jgi:hypothetical protein
MTQLSTPAVTFVTYLWHYLVARLIYDDLARPLIRGWGASVLIVVGCVGAVAYVLGVRTARRKR